MKLTHLAVLALVGSYIAGCKPSPDNVKAAFDTSIYENRPFFEQVCGFELAKMGNVGIRADITDIDAQKRPMGDDGAPATAMIHLTKVHRKAPGESGVLGGSDTPEEKCDAKISFMWGEKTKATTKGVHKAGSRDSWFEAWDFKKL